MKKTFTFILAAAFAVGANAQHPDWTKTESSGNDTYTLYTVLGDGNAVLLDFFATWCGPCQASTPSLQSIWEDYGEGAGGFYVFGMDADNSETDAEINTFKSNLGATYPAFKQCNTEFGYYDNLYGSGGIPLFVLIEPNTGDPANSNVVWDQVGWGSGQEVNQITSALHGMGIYPTGINSTTADNEVIIFPNPANETATISIKQGEVVNMTVDVYNLVGQHIESVLSGSVSGHKVINLNTSEYEAGIYFVKITRGDEQETIKFNVAH